MALAMVLFVLLSSCVTILTTYANFMNAVLEKIHAVGAYTLPASPHNVSQVPHSLNWHRKDSPAIVVLKQFASIVQYRA